MAQQQQIYPNLHQQPTAMSHHQQQPLPVAGGQMQLAPNVITAQPTNTTLIVNNHNILPQNMPRGRDWSVGLFDCCHNMKHCLCYICFGPCYAGCQAQRMGESCCVGCCMSNAGHLAMRTKIRTAHGIEGTICNDCCTLAFCGPCALCQMSVEMDKMGYRD